MKASYPRPLLLLTSLFIFPPSSFLLAQGSLTPPGAPAATMKTLDQLEPRTPISTLPFTIGTRGSYYVTGNLTGVAGQHGIIVNADHVTVDLGGFDLVGPGSGAATSGIRVNAARTNVTIRNGSVRGWGGVGVAAETNACFGMHVEQVRATGNGAGGILLGSRGTALHCDASNNLGTGIVTSTICKVIECTASGNTGAASDGINLNSFSLARGCLAMDNGADGIDVGNACVLEGCVAENNVANGFRSSASGCTLSDCTAQINGALGFASFLRSSFANCNASSNGTGGFNVSTGCTLANCSAGNNTGNGFSIGSGATLENCAAITNAGIGFNGGDGVTLRGCAATDNTGNGFVLALSATLSHCTAALNEGAFGISTSSAATIIGCTIRGAITANSSAAATSAGIGVSTECLVSQCVVSNIDSSAGTLTATTGMGITVGGSSTVERCTVQGCRGDGIRATGSCVIRDNLSDRNGSSTGDGAGVHTTSNENRIEGNSVTGNDRGIDVDVAGNLIIKNTAATNTTAYEIAANNRFGPIINISAAGTAAQTVTDASANVASSLGSTDPWANFLY
jgi:parallel beta-helix repeat protein